MSRDDLQEVLEIERECSSAPWSMRSFEYEISNKDSVFKVSVFGEKAVGFVCLRTMLDMTHILNIAVLPGFRRRGTGSALLREAVSALKLLRPNMESFTLEVRESNTAAIRLYERSEFVKTGKRARYYQNPEENAIIMEMRMHSREERVV
jgi:ribosomal-protein-alanine N-acetyltransferase